MDYKEAMSSDFFFYRGFDLHKETEAEVIHTLFNPTNDLMYNRRFGAGVNEFENLPNSLSLQVLARYQIVNALSYRNATVTNGSDGSVDRRIAFSQNFISFLQNGGELDIAVLYFLYADYKSPQVTKTPVRT